MPPRTLFHTSLATLHTSHPTINHPTTPALFSVALLACAAFAASENLVFDPNPLDISGEMPKDYR